MKTSIVIAAYNEERHIENCLRSVTNQSRPADEIILVDDGSTDKTREIARRYPVKIVKSDHLERARARNKGWRESKGDIIAFAEADSVFNRQWLEEIVKKFQAGADAVIDRRDVFYRETFFQKALSANFKLRYAHYRPFSAWAFKREVLEKTKGFRADMIVAEDTELGKRTQEAGYKIVLADKARQYHKGEPRNLIELIKRSMKFNRYRAANYLKLYPQHSPYGKLVFFWAMAALLVAGFWYHWLWWLLLTLVLLTYLGLVFKITHREKGQGTIAGKYIWALAGIRILDGIAGIIGYYCGVVHGRPDSASVCGPSTKSQNS